MELTNSKRLMYSASYVTTQLTPDEQKNVESQPGGGAAKANLMRALNLTPQEIERLQAALNSHKLDRGSDEQDKLFAIARRLFTTHHMSTLELAGDLAPLSYDSLTRFAELSSTIKDVAGGTKMLFELSNRRRKVSPIGRIHLERIEMYPAGVQKGELVFTVPMAPGETVAISHKEWSTSTREYEDIVQDFFESYSERGVAEKNDVSMSSESEAKHSSAINFGASLSGSYAGVTLTTTLGITNTNDERQSVKQSMQKTREVTEKASARTRKEHKVSIKLETKTGNEDHSAKTITNTAAVPVRIDYYRMMRKWRTDLFRYGLRQTYDIAIPVPGVRLWALHQRVAELEQVMRVPFVFTLTPDQLTDANWIAKAIEVGASDVPPPPDPQLQATPSAIIDYTPEDQSGISRYGKVDFDVPAGYWLESAEATATVARWPTWSWQWLNGHNTGHVSGPDSGVFKGDLFDYRFRSGSMSATYGYRGISFGTLTLMLTFGRTPSALKAWQQTAWVAIKAAALARYQEKLARAQEERDRLWRLLNGKDTLSLRRLEREELMRLVMSWLLGPDSRLKPGGVEPDIIGPPLTPPVQSTVGLLLKNEQDFEFAGTSSVAPTFTGVGELAAYDAILFGEFVKFMHQAVEWENILYFLYPYFWGSEVVGRDKLLFEHPDPEHERFLRAGYARIVLPIRPGFEEDFTALVETGTLAGHLSSPYMPIAQEIANFARTNYAGIPPANPELHARPLLFPEQRATWDGMQDLMKTIDAFKVKNGHYPAKLTDLPAAAPGDAWGNPFVYRMPGLGADYDLISLGADNEEGGEGLNADISSAAGASLVATWFEYTPTSALDIEMDTKAEDIA
jgi:hypothetical protein